MKCSKITSAATAFLLFASASIVHAAPVINNCWPPHNNFWHPNVPQPVPEPTGLTAFAIGMVAMGLILAYRKIKTASSTLV